MNKNNKAELPNHIGLVPDGARRWAKEKKVSYLSAYNTSMQIIADFIQFMLDNDVSIVSVYLLSVENLKRSKTDLDAVLVAEKYLLDTLLPPIVKKYHIEVIHAGRPELLPPDFAKSLNQLTTKDQNEYHARLNLLAAYNPWDEIKSAVDNEKGVDIRELLWVSDPLDLVIRTSGELRISNFLPLQSGYAEFIFEHKYFNELKVKDFKNYLNEYKRRKRRLGS